MNHSKISKICACGCGQEVSETASVVSTHDPELYSQIQSELLAGGEAATRAALELCLMSNGMPVLGPSTWFVWRRYLTDRTPEGFLFDQIQYRTRRKQELEAT